MASPSDVRATHWNEKAPWLAGSGGKSAAIAGERVARTIPALFPNTKMRFITASDTLINLFGDCYSSIGPTLQLAAETVASRLRRPTTCSRTASLFE